MQRLWNLYRKQFRICFQYLYIYIYIFITVKFIYYIWFHLFLFDGFIHLLDFYIFLKWVLITHLFIFWGCVVLFESSIFWPTCEMFWLVSDAIARGRNLWSISTHFSKYRQKTCVTHSFFKTWKDTAYWISVGYEMNYRKNT